MNAWDDLADILMSDELDACGKFGRDYALAEADAILAAGYRKPRTVATIEELETLTAAAYLYSEKTKHCWIWLPKNAPALVAWGTGGGYTYETDFLKFEAPLTVLHEGDPS